MGLTLVYFWSMNDNDRAVEWAAGQEGRVGLRKGQRWKGEVEPCDRVVIFGPLYKIEQAYKNAGIPVEAEDILPDWTPPWLGEEGAATITSTADPNAAPVVTATETEVAFASPTAQKAANLAGLTPEDFSGIEPSGKTGYTKPDVDAVIARKVG